MKKTQSILYNPWLITVVMSISISALLHMGNQNDPYTEPAYDYNPGKSEMTLYQGKNPYKQTTRKTSSRSYQSDEHMEEAIENYLDNNPDVIDDYLGR